MSYKHNSKLHDAPPDWAAVDAAGLPRLAFARGNPDEKAAGWKYPHHCVVDGVLFLHKDGLVAALEDSREAGDQKVWPHLCGHAEAVGVEAGSMRPAKTGELNMKLIEQLKGVVGAEKAISLILAKPDAKDLAAFGDEITAHVAEIEAKLATVSAELATAKTELATKVSELAAANANPPVATLDGDDSEPKAKKGEFEQSKDGWTKEWNESAELKDHFASAPEYVYYMEHKEQIDTHCRIKE